MKVCSHLLDSASIHSFTTIPLVRLLEMPRGRELTDEERAVIDALHFEGKSSRSIALVLNRDHSGISKYLKKRDEEKKPRPGARRKLNEAQLRLLYRAASNRVISAPRLKAELQLNVSTKTILTYLHRNPNFQRRIKEKNQMLTLAHKQRRFDWCVWKLAWIEEWRKWIFTDEKKWNLDGPDSPVWYWHDKRKEKLYKSRRQAGGGSVMTWGGIGYIGRTPIAFLDGNQDSQCYQRTLERSLLPYLDQIVDGDAVFQQDNCPIHTSASTRRWLLDHQLHVTDWPAKSPDLNPIENAWGYLVHHVYKDGKQYYSLNDLREAIIREWDGMAQDFIKKLIDSMPKRVAKVVEVNGNAIGY